MKKRFEKYIKRIIKLVSLQEMKILPGHLAFNIVLMIVPIFSIIGVLGSRIGLENIVGILENNVPDALLSIISSALNLNIESYNIFFFLIFSLWMVSGGCRAIINASDMLYKVKEKSALKDYIKSFFMVIVLFFLICFVIFVPFLGDLIINFFNNHIENTAILIITKIYHFLKYPLSIILMFILIKNLYTIAPSIRIKSKYMSKGAWFTTLSWFLVARVYSYQLNNYSNYNLYYGSLSNILILLVFVYFMAYLFTIGLSLNADDYLTSIKNE